MRHPLRSLVTLVATALATACSSSSSPDAAPTAEVDASTSTTESTSPTSFCGALAAYPTRCTSATPAACDTQLSSACSALTGGVLNPSLLDAAGACAASAPCGTAPTSCLATAIAKAAPTQAQLALAEAYCGQCTVVPADVCKKAFLDPTGDSAVIAKLVLPLGDDIANAIADSCVGLTCKATFVTCAEAKVAEQLATSLSADTAKCLLTAIGNAASDGATDTPTTQPASGDGSGDPQPKTDGGTVVTPPPGTHLYDLVIVDADVPPKDTDGSDWDVFGGLPDPLVEVDAVSSDGTIWDHSLPYVSDTLHPAFNATILRSLTDDAIQHVVVKMFDDDVLQSDWIGDCIGSLSAASGPQTFACNDSLAGPGFALRYQLVPHR